MKRSAISEKVAKQMARAEKRGAKFTTCAIEDLKALIGKKPSPAEKAKKH